MKKTKRFACILLSLMMVLVLVLTTACNSSDSKADQGQDKEDYEEEKETDKKEEGSDEHECTVSDWTVTEATCLAAGKKEGTCTVCGKTVSQEIAKLAHEIEKIPAVPATCVATGLSEGEKCSVCETVIKEQTVTEKDPAAHKPKDIPEKPSTCTEHGYSKGIECELCGLVTTETVELPLAAHTSTPVAGKAATCTEDGLTDGKSCGGCGMIMLSQRVIPATGHDFNSEHTCEGCSIVLSMNLAFTLNTGNNTYTVSGMGDFTGTVIVIPETYDGLEVSAIAEEAFSGKTGIKKVIIIGNVEEIGDRAFYGCSALEEVTVPASVTDVGSEAFGECDSLAAINVSSFEQILAWADDFASGESIDITFADVISPYQIYLKALSSLQRNITNYTMNSNNKSYYVSGGTETPMIETIQSVKNDGTNFYNHTKEIDYMSNGAETESEAYYVDGYLYSAANGQPMKINVGYEYIRDISVGSNLNSAVLTEEYFVGATFYRNADGTYYLELVMDPESMGDLMSGLMADALPGVGNVVVPAAKYVYSFDSNGAIASCKSDVTCVVGEMTMRVNNDMRFSDIGSTVITVPTDYTDCTDVSKPACTTHPNAYVKTVPALAPGCFADGRTEGSYCQVCGKDVVSSTVVNETGHDMQHGSCVDCGYAEYIPDVCYELSEDQTYYVAVYYDNVDDVLDVFNGLPVRKNS